MCWSRSSISAFFSFTWSEVTWIWRTSNKSVLALALRTEHDWGHTTDLTAIQAFDVTGNCPIPSQYRRENVSAYNAIACLQGNEPRGSGSIYRSYGAWCYPMGSGNSQPYKSHSGSKRTFLLDSTMLSFSLPLQKLYIGPHLSAPLFTLKMVNVMYAETLEQFNTQHSWTLDDEDTHCTINLLLVPNSRHNRNAFVFMMQVLQLTVQWWDTTFGCPFHPHNSPHRALFVAVDQR